MSQIILPTIKTKNFLWLVFHPIIYIIYLPLWALGILEWYCFLNYQFFWLLLTKIIYFIFIYQLYSFYIVWNYWEEKMNDLFWKTVWLILFGMLIWHLVYFKYYY